MKRMIVALLLLAAWAFATNVNNADFQVGADPTYHVATDMQFTTDFTISLVSGEVASGDPANLQNGDAVCSGATIRVSPSVSAKWATPDYDAVSAYPTCGGGYCPPMESYSTLNQNRNIAWLSSSTWNSEKSYGDSNPLSSVVSHYDTLGHSNFYAQRVTYTNYTGSFYNNKKGGGAVFCKGTMQVLDGTSVKGSSGMPSANSVDFSVDGAGDHPISTRLSDVDCFASIVKYPLNVDDNPSYFRLYYFTSNLPSIASTIATDTITLEVANSGGTCAFADVSGSVSASSSLIDEDIILLEATMRNNGDPVAITGVSSSNSGFSASAFPTGICGTLGFPPSLCPSSNGFDEQINSGSTKHVYVLIQRGSGASGGTVLTFSGETTAGSCGSASTCSDTIDLTGAIGCEIEPPAVELDTMVLAEFTVECQNLAGDPVSCSGNDWSWGGISGDFTERTNSYAHAYATSPPGTSGTMNYESGLASCHSNVSIDNDGIGHEYECEFIPPSATLNIGASRYFDLNCFREGDPAEPDDAEYDLIHGLAGSTSDSSTDGTTYNAPDFEDDGDLRGIAGFNDLESPAIGIVSLADITVTDNGITGEGYECFLSPPLAIMDFGTSRYFDLNCYVNGTPLEPDDAAYDRINGLGGSTSGSSTDGTTYNAPDTLTSGDLRATADFTSGGHNATGIIATAHITVTNETNVTGEGFECFLIPPSSVMDLGTSRYFDLQCYINGTPAEPDDATYGRINGLGGSTSGSSTDGTTYNAPATPTSGDLRAIADFSSVDPAANAIPAMAHINVVNGSSGNDTNNTDDPDDPGASQWCTIGSGPLNAFPGYYGWVGIMCGPEANQTCTGVTWSAETGLALSDSNNAGTHFTVNAQPNEVRRITATVDGDPDHSCWKDVFVQEPECWEYS